MHNQFAKKLGVACLFITALAIGTTGKLHGQCTSCDSEQKLRFMLRGVASIAGKVTFKITVGDFVATQTISGGTVVGPDTNGFYWAESFECVQWSEEITVEPKINQLVVIEYTHQQNHSSSNYSEFEFTGNLNPVIYWTRPSSKCLKFWFDANDDNWVLEPSTFVGSRNIVRMRGVMALDDSQLGFSAGPTSGMDKPQPVSPELTNAPPVGDLLADCPVAAGALRASGSAKSPRTPQKAREQPVIRGGMTPKASRAILDHKGITEIDADSDAVSSPRPPKRDHNKTDKPSTQSRTAAANVTTSSANDYSIATPIGRLRWEMSLGSISQSLSLGQLVYQANAIDGTAYMPERITLSGASQTKQIITDTNTGTLLQVRMLDGMVDIRGVGNGFEIGAYALTNIGPFDTNTGRYVLSNTPTVRWNVANPGGIGRVSFSKWEGDVLKETHEAQWTGTVGEAGTMTIKRHGGKWKEERTYELDGIHRIETVSQFKSNELQHVVQEVYREFYNWGAPGEVFEALVHRVEDPEGKAATTSFTYWDQSSQPGNMILSANYPDGYGERVSQRLSGNGFAPVVSSGASLRTEVPFADEPAGTAGSRRTQVTYTQLSSKIVLEEAITTVAGKMVGVRQTYHDFEVDEYWRIAKFNYTDDSGIYSYEEEWLDFGSKRPVFSVDNQGRTRNYFYDTGFWDPGDEEFVLTSGSGLGRAMKTTVIHGAVDAIEGIANRTTVDITVTDGFGHSLLEESYLSDGDGPNLSALIDRKIYGYANGLLVSIKHNERLTYEAGHYPDGKLQWQKDETGQRTEFVYDEMGRVYQKTIRGRGEDADQVVTFDYDVMGNVIWERRSAGGLSVYSTWKYNLAGELESSVGIDGLTNSVATSFAGGFKTVTETLPTQAVRITSYFRDRQVESVTGSAVVDQFYFPFVTEWAAESYREGLAIYRNPGRTQLNSIEIRNWLGNEILAQSLRFKGTGFRNRFTYYDTDADGFSRQLVKVIAETGRATRFFEHDLLGRTTVQGVDLDGNDLLETNSVDSISVQDSFFAENAGTWEQVTTVQQFLKDNSSEVTTLSRTRSVVPAELSGQEISRVITERAGGGIVRAVRTLNRETGEQLTTINDLEKGQLSTRLERDGRVRSESHSGISTPREYAYTLLGELESVTDLNGMVSNGYDPATRRLVTVTDPLTRQTVYDYYPAGEINGGQLKGVRDAAGNWTYFDYTPQGQVFRQWGGNTYPVEFQYDERGRMFQMWTFRTTGSVDWASSSWPNPAGGDMTQWDYDTATDLLERKIYADGGAGLKAVTYGYNSGNFLTTKINARGETASYLVDSLGRARSIVYSDGTPAASISYDRAGRLKTVSDAAGSRGFSWNVRGQLLDEVYTNGMFLGAGVHRSYDSSFRLEHLELKQNGTNILRQAFGYDALSWLDYIDDETPSGTDVLNHYDYSFKAGTPYVEAINFVRDGGALMTQTYDRDSIGRLAGATATRGAGTVFGINYQFDERDRRYEATLANGGKWNYGYNDRNEVISGKRSLASGAKVGGEQFEYDFDDIGNRTVARFGGDANGANLREAAYGPANALNQLTTRDVPNSIWLTGDAPPELALEALVDGEAFALQRQDDGRFYGEAPVDNSEGPVFPRITIAGRNGPNVVDTESGNRFVPASPESFIYDADGNLVSDGRWTNRWDCENRLVSMEALPLVPDAAKKRVEFGYDYSGRRIRKVVSTWNGSGYVPQTATRFIYDGWNLMAVLDEQSNLTQSFTWGQDLSGTRQGAGGVGGLLAMTVHSTNAQTYFYVYDGNGNVKALVDDAAAIAAEYEYGPFGELIRSTGPAAKLNPFRFSTKFTDDESGWLYYGYRFYDPSAGKWLSRDPIGELGGVNLYQMVGNDMVNWWDNFGLVTSERILATLELMQQARIKFSCCRNVRKFLDAVEKDITSQLRKGEVQEVMEDAKERLNAIRNKLKPLDYKVLKTSLKGENILREYLGISLMNSNVFEALSANKGWNKQVDKLFDIVVTPLTVTQEVTDTDALGAILVVGNALLDVAPESGATASFTKFLTFYKEGYTHAVKNLNELKYFTGDSSFYGQLIFVLGPGLAVSEGDLCGQVAEHFAQSKGISAKFRGILAGPE